MRRAGCLAMFGVQLLTARWLTDQARDRLQRGGMPELQRLCMTSMRSDRQPPVIVIHDIDGSKMRGSDGCERQPRQVSDPRPGVDDVARMLEPRGGAVTEASLLARDTLDPATPRNSDRHCPLD